MLHSFPPPISAQEVAELAGFSNPAALRAACAESLSKLEATARRQFRGGYAAAAWETQAKAVAVDQLSQVGVRGISNDWALARLADCERMGCVPRPQ